MTTKQDVADYINSNLESTLNANEIAYLQERVDPYLAQALINVFQYSQFMVHYTWTWLPRAIFGRW